MNRRGKLWLAAASLFTVGNAAGAAYAGFLGEMVHAGVHVALTAIGVIWVWRLLDRPRPETARDVLESRDRIEQLQQSVDAVALEVERIGEAQRFNEKLQAERVESKR